jgi:cytochrome c-type biogenesis protein CcmH
MRYIWLMLMLLLPMHSFATIDTYRFEQSEDGQKKEQRYHTLVAELRCLVCQNQNLADSNAELAQDLRRQTYEMVKGGASNEEVVDYMVQRYGDFVMYRPPLRPSTLLLWAGPFVIFAIGVIVLVLFIRRRNREPLAQISSEEHERAKSLLDADDK